MTIVDGADRHPVTRQIRADRTHHLRIGAAVAEATGECGQHLGVVLHRLDGLIVLQPEPALERTQEGVALRERARILGGQEAARLELGEREARRRSAQRRVRVPVTELEHLDEELDVDEPSAPGLDGDRVVVRGATLPGDARAHARDLRHLVRSEAPSVDEAGERLFEEVVQVASGAKHTKAELSGIHTEFKIWESLWPAL